MIKPDHDQQKRGKTLVWWLALTPHSKKVLAFLCGVWMFWPGLSGFSLGTLASLQGQRLTGDSKLAVVMSVNGCWPHDKLATCPGCTWPLSLWQLVWVSSPTMTLNWLSRRRQMDGPKQEQTGPAELTDNLLLIYCYKWRLSFIAVNIKLLILAASNELWSPMILTLCCHFLQL